MGCIIVVLTCCWHYATLDPCRLADPHLTEPVVWLGAVPHYAWQRAGQGGSQGSKEIDFKNL